MILVTNKLIVVFVKICTGTGLQGEYPFQSSHDYKFRCHGESGIPKLLYPKFSSEYCTPVHDSLVNPVRGYNIRVVD